MGVCCDITIAISFSYVTYNYLIKFYYFLSFCSVFYMLNYVLHSTAHAFIHHINKIFAYCS